MSFCLVLLAAGNSERFKSQIPKPFVKIGEKTLLDHSLIKLSQIKEIKKIILVLEPDLFFEYWVYNFDVSCIKRSKKINNSVTSNINKYCRLSSFKKRKPWFINVINVNTPSITHRKETLKNHLKFFIVLIILNT